MEKRIILQNLRDAGTAAILATAVVAILLIFTFNGKITGFFRIGDVLPLSPLIDKESVHIQEGEVGYDGQLFLTIALDPALSSDGTLNALDNPKYRYRRIGFPLAGHLLGFGIPSVVPYALVGINLACIFGIVFLISAFRQRETAQDQKLPSPLWILALPGIWVSLCLTTSELFGSLLFVAALLLLRLRRYGLASVALCVACLTRETYLAATVVLAGCLLVQHRIKPSATLLLGMTPTLGWLLFVDRNIQAGTAGSAENLGVPFSGIITKIETTMTGGLSAAQMFEGYCFALLLFAALLAGIAMVRSLPSRGILGIALLPCIAILSVSKMQILEYHANYLRIFLDTWIILLLIPGPKWFSRARGALLLLSAMASLAYVLNYISS